jgi:hypothetical protein
MAVNLAKDFVLDRLSEVISTVAKRLTNVGLFEDAAKLYEDINALKEVCYFSWSMILDVHIKVPTSYASQFKLQCQILSTLMLTLKMFIIV